MKTFTVEIKCDTIVFKQFGPQSLRNEVSRLLNEVSRRVFNDKEMSGALVDMNSNVVGEFWTEEEY